jgi:hypothetical protein
MLVSRRFGPVKGSGGVSDDRGAKEVGFPASTPGKEINLTGGFRFPIVMRGIILLGMESGERRLEEEGI